MARRLSFLAVERLHHAALVGRLPRGAEGTLSRGKEENSEKADEPFLGRTFSQLVPKDFPQENDLLARVAMPFSWQKADHVLSLRPAGSATKLIRSVCSALRTIRADVHDAIGIVLDADNKEAPRVRLEGWRHALAAEKNRLGLNAGFAVPDAPGMIHSGPLKSEVSGMPDVISAGTLADIRLDRATTHCRVSQEYLGTTGRRSIVQYSTTEI